jgi:alginate O-acetyltransferase complex protein AlgI
MNQVEANGRGRWQLGSRSNRPRNRPNPPMLFQSSLYFVRLAIAVLIYWSIGNRIRARFLLLAIGSLAVFGYLLHKHLQNQVALIFAVVMGVLVVVTYCIGRRLLQKRSQPLLLLGLFLPFFVFLLPLLANASTSRFHSFFWLVPISLGFFALRQSHFIFECYRGGIKHVDFVSYVTYIVFFPSLIAGPLERFPKFVTQVTQARLSWDHFGVATERLIVGALKKFVVADGLIAAALPPVSLTQNGFTDVTWATLVFACTAKFLYVYFDFAGYTDMARGTARLFGIELIPNFNFPLLRSNLAEFWRSWHISLSSFLRDYLYFPLVVKYRNTVVPLLATMIASAAWHGINPGWLFWGAHHGIGLVFLARFQRIAINFPQLMQIRTTLRWRIFATVATWYFVILGFAFTWHPDSAGLSLKTYLKFLTFGLLG